MASCKQLLVFLLLTLLSSIHIEARDNQMFNKIPSNTNELEKQIPYHKEIDNNPINNPNVQQPNSLPENENSYGLYAHDTVTPNNNNKNDDDDDNFPNDAKYLPKNYNPVAYVTEPEDLNQDSTFSEKSYSNTPISNNNNYESNVANNYEQHGVKVFDEESNTSNNMKYNSYYNKGNDRNNKLNHFNNRYNLATNNYNKFRGRVSPQPQGMSDTRFLENGRYYYDINSEKYSVHPNENAIIMAMRNKLNKYNHANSYHYNNFNHMH